MDGCSDGWKMNGWLFRWVEDRQMDDDDDDEDG